MTAAADVRAPRGAAGDVSTARLLARTCAAEWTRLWTVKATWWLLAAAAVTMVGIASVAGLDAAGDPGSSWGDPAWPVAAITAFPAQFALLALTITAATSDYATGGIAATLQWTPRRAVLFLARAGVAIGAAASLGTLLALAAVLAGFTAAHPVLSLPWDVGLDVLGTVAFVFAAGGGLGVGLGFLLRSTAGALVAVFLLMLVLPLLLPQFGYEWTSDLAGLLPGTGAAFLLLGDVGDLTGASSMLTMLAWAGAALLLGWLRFLRHDATA